MKKIFVFILMAALFITSVVASPAVNEGFKSECQNFYNSSRYFTIAKWTYNETLQNYNLAEKNDLYSYYDTTVNGGKNSVAWASDVNLRTVLVKANETLEFKGGKHGQVNSTQDISDVTFCGYRSHSSSVSGGSNNGINNVSNNGVPEFPSFAMGAAVLLVALGLVFLRK